jgi:starch synthase (maltosyl-transferring)
MARSKIHFPGRSRVVIDRFTPSLEDGSLAIKRVAGDTLQVNAHAFADGHDRLCVYLRYRLVGAKQWQEAAMRELGNDEFSASFSPPAIGLYEFTVAGLIDHFGSWHEGFIKKVDSGQTVDVELAIGAELLRSAAERATGDDARQLTAWSGFIGDAKRDLSQRVHLVRSHELYQLAHRYPDRSLETLHPSQLLLVERELAAFSTWYEFFPRSCSDDPKRHGTLIDACKRIPEIARLGFNIAYLPPIHPIGKLHRKGKNNALTAASDDVGSPWAIGSDEGGHKSIHPQLGTIEDFQTFRRECEAHGLEVALDIAFQCAPDHPYVKQHPQWFNWRPDGTVQYAENPPKKYQDILPFNFETEDWEALWLELKSVFDYWIEQGVKVFRVDNPHTKPMEFWRWCIFEIKKAHPEVIFLAEAFTRPKRKYRLAKGGFTHGYTYFTWRNTPQEMREYLTELTQSETREYFWPNFWPNTPDILHDDLQHGNRATFIGRLVLAATLSSNYGMYGPAYELMDREPFPGKEEYNNNEKYQLKQWDYNAPGNLREEIARINQIRCQHLAFHRTFNLSFAETDNPALLAYVKQGFDRHSQFLVVVNMDWNWVQMGTITLPLDFLGFGSDRAFRVKDLLDPKQPVYNWHGARNFVKLDPLISPAHIFQILT